MVTRSDGLVSVVIAAYNVADYLAETLDSVLAQEGVNLEVVIVNDGSTDETPALIDRFAAQDPRIVAIHQDNGGLGAARNAGIARASGEFLTFCDADDVVPQGAFAAMAASLEASGSDFVIGRAERFSSIERWQPVWITEVHDGAPHRHLTVEDLPVAIKNILECNRMYRREAWDAVGPFPVGGLSEGYVPMVASFLEGRTFDLLDEVTYGWRVRDDGTSSTQQKARTGSLRDRLAALDRAAELIAAHAVPTVTSAWHARVLELDLSGYYQFASIADEEFRSLLAGAARRFLDAADDDALRLVSVHRKVSAWLAAEGHWDALEWFESGRNVASVRRHGDLVEGWPTARPDQLASHVGAEIPARLLALSQFDTTARATLRAVTHTETSIEAELDVWLRGVKRPDSLDEVGLVLRLRDTEHPPLHVAATISGHHAHASIDVTELRTWAGAATGTVVVSARYVWGDAAGETTLRAPSRKLPLSRPSQSAGVRGVVGTSGALELRLTPPAAPTGSLRFVRGAAVATLVAPAPAPGSSEQTPAADDAAVRVRLPAQARRRIAPRAGRSRLAWPSDEPTGVVVPRGLRTRRSPWRWESTARDEAVLVPRGPLLELTDATADDGGLTLTFTVRDRWRLDRKSLRWFPGHAHSGRESVTLRLEAEDLASIKVPTPVTATDPGRRFPATVRFAWSMLDGRPLRWEIGGRVVRLHPGRRRAVFVKVRKPRRR